MKYLYILIWKVAILRLKYLRYKSNKLAKKLTKVAEKTSKHTDWLVRLEHMVFNINNYLESELKSDNKHKF